MVSEGVNEAWQRRSLTAVPPSEPQLPPTSPIRSIRDGGDVASRVHGSRRSSVSFGSSAGDGFMVIRQKATPLISEAELRMIVVIDKRDA